MMEHHPTFGCMSLYHHRQHRDTPRWQYSSQLSRTARSARFLCHPGPHLPSRFRVTALYAWLNRTWYVLGELVWLAASLAGCASSIARHCAARCRAVLLKQRCRLTVSVSRPTFVVVCHSCTPCVIWPHRACFAADTMSSEGPEDVAPVADILDEEAKAAVGGADEDTATTDAAAAPAATALQVRGG